MTAGETEKAEESLWGGSSGFSRFVMAASGLRDTGYVGLRGFWLRVHGCWIQGLELDWREVNHLERASIRLPLRNPTALSIQINT